MYEWEADEGRRARRDMTEMDRYQAANEPRWAIGLAGDEDDAT